MPEYKYHRDDVIRKPELHEIFSKAGRVNAYGLPGQAWQCLIAIMWLFGKRVSEIVPISTKSVYTDDGDLAVQFTVLKKKSYQDPGVRMPFTKRVTLENPYTNYVVDWHAKALDKPYLFYRSQTKMGYIYRQYANNVFKEISDRISPHMFRHSLATQMAERGATAYELLNWFDWDRTDTALNYIKRSGRMTEKLSSRTW